MSEKTRKGLLIASVIGLILAAGTAIGFYMVEAGRYQEVFLPNTKINGIDASKMTVQQMKEEIEKEIEGYELLILERTGAREVIKKDEIGLRSEFDGTLEQIIESQNPNAWITSLWSPVRYEISTMLVYDEELLKERVYSLSCMDESQFVEPKDAYISEYQSETKSYEIIPPEDGTALIQEHVFHVVAQAVNNLQYEVDLDVQGCYKEADVTDADENLRMLAATMNQYVGAVVNHTFGEEKEVLDGNTIHKWLRVENDSVEIDETKVSEYIRSLAKKYNTAYEKKQFKTSYGQTVTISGPYGWRMNEAAETAAVIEVIKAGEQQTREPEYLQTGASHGERDYGDTYVEINLTAQHLFFYKDGELIVETNFVSGNASRGWSTPSGVYPLTYKQRNAVLRGENYATPVSYWMPFNGNIGLHDANWRAEFGGSIYKTNGSHGCINLPPAAAKTIFEHISAGIPVFCYELPGTERAASSSVTPVPVPETTAALTQPTETTAAVPDASAGIPQQEESEAQPSVPEGESTETAPPATEQPAETTAPVPETPEISTETMPLEPGAIEETAEIVSETMPVGPGAPVQP